MSSIIFTKCFEAFNNGIIPSEETPTAQHNLCRLSFPGQLNFGRVIYDTCDDGKVQRQCRIMFLSKQGRLLSSLQETQTS